MFGFDGYKAEKGEKSVHSVERVPSPPIDGTSRTSTSEGVSPFTSYNLFHLTYSIHTSKGQTGLFSYLHTQHLSQPASYFITTHRKRTSGYSLSLLCDSHGSVPADLYPSPFMCS